MKPFNLNKKRIKTAAAAVICCLVLTSCWEDFDDKFTKPSETSPGVRPASCQLTATGITVNWIEPDAVAYTGMRIKITDGTATTETTVSRGTTTTGEITYAGSSENTITVTAIYSTGYEIESLVFRITPPSGNQTLRFMYTAEDLNDLRNTLGNYCILMEDIDLSGYSSGTGWNPIGTSGSSFTGIFDGNGHTISNLTINDSTNDYKGLFGYTSGAEIKNLTLEAVSVNGHLFIGALAGYNAGGTVSNCSASGAVTGNYRYVGGLVGQKSGGTVKDSHASVNVSSNSISAGGLIGHLGDSPASITNCYATGSVQGSSSVGGLVGYAGNSTITNCYATGNVIIDSVYMSNNAYAGGLVGNASLSSAALIEKCYALGDVSVQFPGTPPVFSGSLAGRISIGVGCKVANCFARGDVDAHITNSGSSNPLYAGGLIGQSTGTVTIQYCYNTGTIFAETDGTGTVAINGFIPTIAGTITACYYNRDTTGRTDTGTGYTYLTTSQMKDSANYSGWDFAGTPPSVPPIWSISSSINNGYPFLTGMVP